MLISAQLDAFSSISAEHMVVGRLEDTCLVLMSITYQSQEVVELCGAVTAMDGI